MLGQIDNIITAMLGKNVRSEERAKVRAENANINIQINFNMKDKAPGFAGKKIDNFVEIEQKDKGKVEGIVKGNEDLKRIKKKNAEGAEKAEKERIVETPKKVRAGERKMGKMHEKTPQRLSVQRKEERSKSAGQRLVKRKAAKSVENIWAGHRKITYSPDHSAEKSRSHSKSKENLRSSESSLKNLQFFSNSGLKSKLKKGKDATSRERIASKKEEHEKIRKFMQEKKRKEKVEKLKQLKRQQAKKEKVYSELKKVEAERRANASKPYSATKRLFPQEERFPLVFDDEDLDDSNGMDNLRRQAEKMIHDSPTPKHTIETIPIQRSKPPKSKPKIPKTSWQHPYDKSQGKSNEKFSSKRKMKIIEKYYSGAGLTEKQWIKLQECAKKIQALWHGFKARKSFAKKLSDESTKIRYIKNSIQNKKALWNDEENSIVNIQKQGAKEDEEVSSQNYINYNSNAHSNVPSNVSQSSVNSRLIATKGDRYKRLSIQLEQQAALETKEKERQHNEKMMREIQELRKMLEQKSQMYKSLEEENSNLKRNIQNKAKEEDLVQSIDFIEIRMPKKIESPHSSARKREESRALEINNQVCLNFSPEKVETQPNHSLNSFKKQFQAFECSSPSNAMLQQQLKSLKSKNIEGIFKKKEITIQQKYEKKYEMFDKMLSDKLFSPRTYSMKKKELQSKLQSEILQVKNRKEEAKRVVGFIADVNEEEEAANSLRSGQREQDYNFKKDKEVNIKPKEVKDTFTNTSPRQQEFKSTSIAKNKNRFNLQKDSNSQYSEQDDKLYKKYWTDDIQEVHNYTLEKIQKIDEAMRSDGEKKQSDGTSEYNSQGHEKQAIRETQYPAKEIQVHKTSGDFQVNLATLKQSYEDYLQEEIPSESERKAKEIFNKIDLSECKSDESMQSSHQNICKLLNTRVFQGGEHQIKEVDNLYISEAEFNKKRKEEQLSRSNSFQKSNKSISVGGSQVQAKGFITNLTFIKQFCISVCEFIRSSVDYKEPFVGNISQCIQFDFLEFMKAYRITLGGQVKNNYNTYTDEYLYHYFKVVSSKDQAISHDLFSTFIKAYEEEKATCTEWNKPYYSKEIREMREYFLISIIDCFNESLEYEKPGGVHGQPFPWMNNAKRLSNHRHSHLKCGPIRSQDQEETEEDKKLDQIFGSSIAKIIQWGSYLCGFIADPMPMEMGDSEIANLSQDQLNSIRENRIGLMLEKWLAEQEEKITNATGEYTEVLLNLGEKIIELLITQCMEQLQDLQQ